MIRGSMIRGTMIRGTTIRYNMGWVPEVIRRDVTCYVSQIATDAIRRRTRET